MASNESNNTIVMFGGTDENHVSLGDTWVFNGSAWIDPQPTQAPCPRHSARMAYSPVNQGVILFGGTIDFDDPAPPECVALAGMQDDTWLWTGTDWQELNPVARPTPRASFALSVDKTVVPNRVTLFGGFGECPGPGNATCGDTWFWIAGETTWDLCEQCTGTNTPTPRVSAAMAYHAKRGKVVLFGGLAGGPLSDTWQLAGTTWSQPGVGVPAARSQHRMAYDVNRKMIVMFGGCLGGCDQLEEDPTLVTDETWTIDGGAWTLQNPPMPRPAPRCCEGLAYIGGTFKKVVLFGGIDQQTPNMTFGDTWQWDGMKWCQFGSVCP